MKNPKLKNGFFVGIEGDLGSTRYRYTYHRDDEVLYSSNFSITNFTFDLGLAGGYQYYFGNSQNHGIKISTHAYSGFGNTFDASSFSATFQKFYISYIPIKFGFDIKYLWDFYRSNKHIIGLNTGLGYQANLYINGKIKGENFLDDPNAKDYEAKLNNIFACEIYPVIGLHYYYENHQVELMYRFGGLFSGSGNSSTLETSSITSDNKVINQSYLTFNYSYRF